MHASSGARAARARTRHGNTAARLSRVPLFMNVTRTVDPLIRGWFLLVSRDAVDRVTPPKRHGLRSQADIRGPRKAFSKKVGWDEMARGAQGVEKRKQQQIQSSPVIYDAFSRSNRDFRKSAIILPSDSPLFPLHDYHPSWTRCCRNFLRETCDLGTR